MVPQQDMMPMIRLLFLAGLGCLLMAAVLYLISKYAGFFKMPGDIVWRKGNFTVYFPLLTSILLSVLLTLISFLIRYFKK